MSIHLGIELEKSQSDQFLNIIAVGPADHASHTGEGDIFRQFHVYFDRTLALLYRLRCQD